MHILHYLHCTVIHRMLYCVPGSQSGYKCEEGTIGALKISDYFSVGRKQITLNHIELLMADRSVCIFILEQCILYSVCVCVRTYVYIHGPSFLLCHIHTDTHTLIANIL